VTTCWLILGFPQMSKININKIIKKEDSVGAGYVD